MQAFHHRSGTGMDAFEPLIHTNPRSEANSAEIHCTLDDYGEAENRKQEYGAEKHPVRPDQIVHWRLH